MKITFEIKDNKIEIFQETISYAISQLCDKLQLEQIEMLQKIYNASNNSKFLKK